MTGRGGPDRTGWDVRCRWGSQKLELSWRTRRHVFPGAAHHDERVDLAGDRPIAVRSAKQFVDDGRGARMPGAAGSARPRVVKGDCAARAHMWMPRLPVLATAFATVVAVDEHEVDIAPGPRSADVLAASDVPVDRRPVAPGRPTHGKTSRGGVRAPAGAQCVPPGEERIDQVQLARGPQRPAEHDR